MSYTLDYGYTRNTTTTKNLVIADNNNANIWALAPVQKPGSLPASQVTVDAVNTTSPRDRVARLRRWNRKIENIYADADVNAVNRSPVTTGIDIGNTIRGVFSITDSVTGKIVYVPWKVSVDIQTGIHEAITGDVMKNILTDTLSVMFPKSSVTSNQIALQANGSFVFLDETT